MAQLRDLAIKFKKINVNEIKFFKTIQIKLFINLTIYKRNVGQY